MREQQLVWFWACEHKGCGWRWLANGVDAPEKCAKCKRRGWHTKSKLTQQLEASLAVTPTPIVYDLKQNGEKPDMQALRDICAGKVFAHSDDPLSKPMQSVEIPICGFTWWEESEHFECLMDAGHRESKHGLRGMVRRLDD